MIYFFLSSAHPTRVVLSHDRPSHQRLHNRHPPSAAVRQVKSQILRTHLVARLQYARPHQKGWSLQNADAKQQQRRSGHTVVHLNVIHWLWRWQFGHSQQLHNFVILHHLNRQKALAHTHTHIHRGHSLLLVECT